MSGRSDPKEVTARAKPWQVSEAAARHLGLGPVTVRCWGDAGDLALRKGAGSFRGAVRMQPRTGREQ